MPSLFLRPSPLLALLEPDDMRLRPSLEKMREDNDAAVEVFDLLPLLVVVLSLLLLLLLLLLIAPLRLAAAESRRLSGVMVAAITTVGADALSGELDSIIEPGTLPGDMWDARPSKSAGSLFPNTALRIKNKIRQIEQ